MMTPNTEPERENRDLNVVHLGLIVPLGYIGMTILPFWVGAVAAAGLLPISGAGWIATGELFATAFANVLASFYVLRPSPRRLAQSGAGLAVLGNALAMVPSLTCLAAGRVVSGFGLGAFNAALTRTAAMQARPHQVLSTLQIMLLPSMATMTLISPLLIREGGIRLLFGGVALLCLLVAGACGSILPRQPRSDDLEQARPIQLRFTPLAICTAVSAYTAAQYAILAYLVLIGHRLAFGADSVGFLLSAAIFINMGAPILSRIIGERAGLYGPILTSLLIMMGGVALVTFGTRPWSFAGGTVIIFFAPVFVTPFVFALLARLDQQGQYASAFPGFLMVGAAAGPAAGGGLAATGAIASLGLLAIGLVGLSSTSFVMAMARERVRTRDC